MMQKTSIPENKIISSRPIVNFLIEDKTIFKVGINKIGLKRELRRILTIPLKLKTKKIKLPEIYIKDFWIFKNKVTINYEESWSR
ncbi:MAG: hypothetical protein PHU45_02785 [Bacilli bacterium]|nr:hypothetical protein [Bacilli bacterium]